MRPFIGWARLPKTLRAAPRANIAERRAPAKAMEFFVCGGMTVSLQEEIQFRRCRGRQRVEKVETGEPVSQGRDHRLCVVAQEDWVHFTARLEPYRRDLISYRM